jgi:hypothetical protein
MPTGDLEGIDYVSFGRASSIASDAQSPIRAQNLCLGRALAALSALLIGLMARRQGAA